GQGAFGRDGAPAAAPGTAGGAGRWDTTPLGMLKQLCDRLVATARPDRFAHLPRTWIGPLASAETTRPWPPGVLGYDLYTGRVGPALALAAASRVLGDGPHRVLTTQIFSTTAGILADHRYEHRSLQQAGYGGYTGLAGTLFALASAGRLLDEPGWTTAAQEALPLVVHQVREQPDGEVPLDVIGGVAGVLSCLDAIGGPHAQAGIAELSGILVRGVSVDGAARDALFSQSGFAHGVSGVLHALSRIHPQLPAERRPPVLAALRLLVEQLERFHDPAERNWFSSLATPGTFSTGWCHGAAGIALALSAYARVGGDDVRPQLDLAVSNTLRHGFGRNLTWCHGDLGNHDVLSGVAAADGESRHGALRAELDGIERRWLQPEVFVRKLTDMSSRYAHTNSAMVGTAGIVLHLVNRLDPATRVSPVALNVEVR
ncbi:MAG TPA: lanthionine synthetase LanC family protein, partial [Kineosporiaceae bacterium]|nr:lanthionine synthetase LanC family protein [Kineosporiaceae bacterium]